MKKAFAIAMGMLAVLQYAAQGQKLSALVDKNRVLIGEHFQITIELSGKRPELLSMPFLDTNPHFEILSRSKVDTQTENGNYTLVQKLTATSWDSGRWNLMLNGPNLPKAKPILMDVVFSPLAPRQSYHDVKDIIEVASPSTPNWYWYLAGLALIAVLFALFFPGSKGDQRKKVLPDKKAISVALKRIEELQRSKDSSAKQFYTEIVNILRDYLENGRNIPSSSYSSEKLADTLLILKINKETATSLIQVLRMSDLVKFAQWQPTQEDRRIAAQILKDSLLEIDRT